MSFAFTFTKLLVLTYPSQSYLRVKLATIDFENGRYSEAADKLTASIATVTSLFLRTAYLEPRLKIFTRVRPYEVAEVTSTS